MAGRKGMDDTSMMEWNTLRAMPFFYELRSKAREYGMWKLIANSFSPDKGRARLKTRSVVV
jgi:hypothetical protein